MATDSIADALKAAPISQEVRAAAWDAFYQSADQTELTAKLQTLALPQATKAALWDAKGGTKSPMTFAVVNGKRVPVEEGDPRGDVLLDNLHALSSFAPMAGGVVGGIVGGAPGAAVGGAAGAGYKQLAEHATELPGALMDVLRNLRSYPAATLRGFVGGGATGTADAAIEGAKQGVMQKAGDVVATATKPAGAWLMQKAIKPTQALLDEYRTTGPDLARTLLKEGISVTRGGLEKLQQLFADNNAAIRNAVAQAPGTIDKNLVASRALTTAGKLAQQTNPEAALRALSETVQGFLDHPVYQGALTVPEAQAMKVGTYRTIGNSYGELSGATKETMKSLARGLKEEVAARVPGIASMNARDTQLMAGMDAVGRRVAQAGNLDPVGFAWAAVHQPASFLAALIDRNAAVKSLIARGLWDEAGRLAKVAPNLIRTAVTAIASGAPDASADTPPDSAGAPGQASAATSGRR